MTSHQRLIIRLLALGSGVGLLGSCSLSPCPDLPFQGESKCGGETGSDNDGLNGDDGEGPPMGSGGAPPVHDETTNTGHAGDEPLGGQGGIGGEHSD